MAEPGLYTPKLEGSVDTPAVKLKLAVLDGTLITPKVPPDEPGVPGIPCGPVAPVFVASPLGPVKPVVPGGPCVPVAPVFVEEPGIPVAPIAPGLPDNPGAPVVPVEPVLEAYPDIPGEPVAPVRADGFDHFHAADEADFVEVVKRAVEGLVRASHRLRRHQRHGHRARGNLRAGTGDHRL